MVSGLTVPTPRISEILPVKNTREVCGYLVGGIIILLQKYLLNLGCQDFVDSQAGFLSLWLPDGSGDDVAGSAPTQGTVCPETTILKQAGQLSFRSQFTDEEIQVQGICLMFFAKVT